MAAPDNSISEPAGDPESIHVRWRPTGPIALSLTAVWAIVTFAPVLLARELSFEIGGASVTVWIAALFGPLIYVLLAWLYERLASRLDERPGERGR